MEYQKLKEEYESISEQIRKLYLKQNEILKELHECCPHENVYVVEEEFHDFFDDEPYNKCKDCGKILK